MRSLRLEAIMSDSLVKEKSVPQAALVPSPSPSRASSLPEKKSRGRRIREIIWDSLDGPPEERKLLFKIDIFILSVVLSLQRQRLLLI